MYQYAKPPQKKPNIPQHWFFWGLLGALLITIIITVYLILTALNDPSSYLSKDENNTAPQAEQIESNEDPIVFDDETKPLQHRNGPASQSWDGKSRLNILLLGVDDRSWEEDNGPPRTDTMILLTINPKDNTAGMLSLPRDLWVEIPGQDYYKINQAYGLGEAQGLSGGGAGLAMATVEQLLGISVPFYAQINFNAFVQVIDQMGGVKINVPETLTIDPIDDEVKTLKPGVQTLPGNLALAYVRARNTAGGDFDRAQRQQQVLRAIEKRLTNPNLLLPLIAKTPAIYKEINNGVSTNLTPQQIFNLARLIPNIPSENIVSLAINEDHAVAGQSWNGLYILTPIPEKIEQLKTRLFSGEIIPTVLVPTATVIQQPTEVPTLSPQDEPEPAIELLPTEIPAPIIDSVSEEAKIGVHNGTRTGGLAGDTADLFRANHLNVTEVDNADKLYDHTAIIDYSGKPDTLSALIKIINLPDIKLYNQYNPDSEIDLLVILGQDYVDKGKE